MSDQTDQNQTNQMDLSSDQSGQQTPPRPDFLAARKRFRQLKRRRVTTFQETNNPTDDNRLDQAWNAFSAFCDSLEESYKENELEAERHDDRMDLLLSFIAMTGVFWNMELATRHTTRQSQEEGRIIMAFEKISSVLDISTEMIEAMYRTDTGTTDGTGEGTADGAGEDTAEGTGEGTVEGADGLARAAAARADDDSNDSDSNDSDMDTEDDDMGAATQANLQTEMNKLKKPKGRDMVVHCLNTDPVWMSYHLREIQRNEANGPTRQSVLQIPDKRREWLHKSIKQGKGEAAAGIVRDYMKIIRDRNLVQAFTTVFGAAYEHYIIYAVCISDEQWLKDNHKATVEGAAMMEILKGLLEKSFRLQKSLREADQAYALALDQQAQDEEERNGNNFESFFEDLEDPA